MVRLCGVTKKLDLHMQRKDWKNTFLIWKNSHQYLNILNRPSYLKTKFNYVT